MQLRSTFLTVFTLSALAGCAAAPEPEAPAIAAVDVPGDSLRMEPAADGLLDKYVSVRLTADLSSLSEGERRMLPLLVEAARAMDEIFWAQAYGSRDSLLAVLANRPALRRFAEINYGPWDRLAGDSAFIAGVGSRPPGANFYPSGMTREEFESAASGPRGDSLRSAYTLVRRGTSGELVPVPYHVAFRAANERAAALLRQAAPMADDPGLRRYLELRADALLTDDYRASDLAWLDMKENDVELVIGPIETYDDQLFGYKAANEAYVLIKDREWSRRLARYAELLPMLQRDLPVPAAFKSEQPGTDSDLNAYDAVYYAGQANAGSKTIAINLPNDEQVQLEKGTRRLQLRNAMQAKFDRILAPIADVLIAPDQRQYVEFDAFFENTMFHEVAHGLGIKNTINDRGTVREALKERAGALEEGKADVLGLYMVTRLAETGDLPESEVRDNYVTFMAGIFRSVRFGASSAHGRANMARFNYFQERGAFERDPATGTYRVNFDRMREAMNALSEHILRLQGEGDYEGVGEFTERYGVITPELQAGLDRLGREGIPVDIVFDQGVEVMQGGD